MSANDLLALTERRDSLLGRIRKIEESCEGIENENNAKRVQDLNLEYIQLSAQKQEMTAKLSALDKKLSAINSEITKLSGTGIGKILEAIKNKRWYFFKNTPKIIFDKKTGLLWANLNMFPYCQDSNLYSLLEVDNVIQQYDFEIEGFRIPNCYELWNAVCDKTFPFIKTSQFNFIGFDNIKWRIMNINNWCCTRNDAIHSKDLDYNGAIAGMAKHNSALLPCSDYLVSGTNYRDNVSSKNPIYTEKERLQFTLDLFIQNNLWPIFNDEKITELYGKIYFEKPKLLEQLNELQSQIKELQNVTLLSSEFDYMALLSKYDIKSIDTSVIKYYQAVQNWCSELMDKLDYYEKEKEAVISDFNVIGLKLSKKYENHANLTDDENAMLFDRQSYFRKNFSLGMNSIKAKILAVKKQADELEYRIDDIDNSDDSIYKLALLEQEQRASFSLIAENTAKIIKNALLKIEFFEQHHKFVMNVINIWEKWTDDYRVFKTIYKEDMKNSCHKNSRRQ